MLKVQGLKFDEHKPRVDLISPIAILELSKVLTYGASKYGANNWRKGIVFSRLLAAALRHILYYMSGQSIDPETGLSHVAHAMCCMMFILEFEATQPHLDDRYQHRSNKSSDDQSEKVLRD